MPKGQYGDQNGKDKPARKQQSVGTNYDAPFRGYINVNLTSEQKAAFDAWVDGGAWSEQLDFFVADGVNISVKYEPKGQAFLASATQRRVGSPNAGLVVTARGRVATLALLRVLYILVILSHAERWEDVQPLADPDRW